MQFGGNKNVIKKQDPKTNISSFIEIKDEATKAKEDANEKPGEEKPPGQSVKKGKKVVQPVLKKIDLQ